MTPIPADGLIEEAIIKDGITIKGGRDGLVVTLGLGAWHNTLAILEDRIAGTPEFFKGARVALNVGARRLLEVDARVVRDMFARYDVILWGLMSEDDETSHMAATLGLNAELPRPRSAEPALASPIEPAPPDDPAAGLVAHRTLRSGQQLRHLGSIALLGDVNPGAEIVAGGDIIVWGKLRGTVHAGAMGNENAQVCALNMQPTQLRIARHIARSPEERRRKSSPEVARVRNGQIVVESWEVK
jgi:septum site-determining protein MinC